LYERTEQKIYQSEKIKLQFIAPYVSGVNILTLFRYFGYGTVLDFWHFSEKFLEKVILFHPKNEKLFQNLKRQKKV